MKVSSERQVLRYSTFILLMLAFFSIRANNADAFSDIENFQFTATQKQIAVELVDAEGETVPFKGWGDLSVGKQNIELHFENGKAVFEGEIPLGLRLFRLEVLEKHFQSLYHISDKGDYWRFKHIPLWYSILPPLLAIGLALIVKEVILSLFAGVWLGIYIVNGMELRNIFRSLLQVADTYAIKVLQDAGHLSIIIFSLLIGAMVALVNKNGGMQGIVNKLTPYAKNSKMAQFITWLMGVLIFFDDYANTLVVGNTMRSLTDRFKISREKLAYIVDSTAAPIAAIAFITTWIGAELGYIETALVQLDLETSPYSVFLNSLKYAFYPVFTLIFILFIIFLGKDYGPMREAEKRAAESEGPGPEHTKLTDEAMQPKEGIAPRWYNAFFPVITVVLGTIAGLIVTGYDASIWQETPGFLNKISATIGSADSYQALIWASLGGLIVAMMFSLGNRLLSIQETADSIMAGFKSLLQPVVILVAAWSLALLTEELHTSTFLIDLATGRVDVYYLPFITFILAAITAFSTGSSWSTMAILYPIILPATYALGISDGLEIVEIMPIFYHVTAVVIGGSVLGDHCSPISDTTILSSLASGCDHLSHVKTQMPYALTVGAVTLIFGALFFALGIPWWVSYLSGFGMLYGIVRWV